jgi:Na+/H+ antiporter NhaC
MIRCVSALRSYIDTILLKSYLFFFSLLICSGVGDMMKPYYRTHVSDPNEIGDCETKLRCMLRAI